MRERINWGIIGLGKIAHKFAADILLTDDASLFGVASRDKAKAKGFAQQYNAVKHYGSYEEVAKDPDIDIVYIATPHALHFENTMMCLESGKNVLCEKPMGMNTGEVRVMVDKASEKELFLMEGIWSRFIPGMEKVLELIAGGKLGSIIYVRADFGFKPEYNPEGRIFNKSLGGGSLMDIGLYPVYLSLLTLGMPSNIKALARMAPTGADSYCSMLFDYENGSKAILESTFEATTPTEAYIYGTEGTIKLHSRFHHPHKISLYRNGMPEETFNIRYHGNGYSHEIEEVCKCLKDNKTESSKLPLETSINLISLLDLVREEIGLNYD
jgi:predicted dehydrogenase